MFQSIKTYLGLTVIALMLGACAPADAVIVSASTGVAPTPVASAFKLMPVAAVQIEIGIGSPIPVDAFISAELPDTCAQLAEVRVERKPFEFQISLESTVSTEAHCFRDTLPFRMYVPLNMVNQPEGTYTVKVNGVTTTFRWPSEPTITPEPIGPAPATQTYRNPALGIELDYPAGWEVEEMGNGASLWSKRLDRVGVGGVPADIAKIDIATEEGSTVTLDELLARQKQGVAEVNGQILSEEEWTLANGLRAVRLNISAIGDSAVLLTVIDGRPIILAGFGDRSQFDAVARSLRPIELAEYRGPNPYRATPEFAVQYDPLVWSFVEDMGEGREANLVHRSLPNCTVWLKAGPVDAQPLGTVQLAGYDWTLAQIQSNILSYSTPREDLAFIFGVFLPDAYVADIKSPCQQAFEDVLSTFRVVTD